MISPSILASDFSHLKDIFPTLEEIGVKLLHFDVMDNHFVPNLTFGPQFVHNMAECTSIPLDVHLMIDDPYKNIPLYIGKNIHYISAHIEAFTSVQEILDTAELLKSKKTAFGLAIKPITPVEKLIPFLPFLDFVLVMTVEPGFGGQTLLPNTLEKIEFLQNYKTQYKLQFMIEADGGITAENMTDLIDCGTDILVMGSAFFNHQHPESILTEYLVHKNAK